MSLAVLNQLEGVGRRLVPPLLTLVFVIFGAVNWPLPWIAPVAPPLALMAVYYWAIHRPDLFGSPAAFLTGILVDALSGLPLGITALCYLLIHRLTLSQRNLFVSHSFRVLWGGYAVAAFLVLLMQWIGVSLINKAMMPFLPAFVQLVLGVVIFPLPAALMTRVQRRFFSVIR